MILSFHAEICEKKEIVVSEGNFMNEMIFIKNGKISIELSLPSIISEQINKTNKLTFTLNQQNKFKFKNNLNHRTKSIDEQYVKLLDLRQNEHYGDIMMFLNKRSPLQLKVGSKYAELFYLRKTDVINISMLFPDIWRQIISNSLYNMNQINILIKRALNYFYNNNQVVINKLNKQMMINLNSRDSKKKSLPIEESEEILLSFNHNNTLSHLSNDTIKQDVLCKNITRDLLTEHELNFHAVTISSFLSSSSASAMLKPQINESDIINEEISNNGNKLIPSKYRSHFANNEDNNIINIFDENDETLISTYKEEKEGYEEETVINFEIILNKRRSSVINNYITNHVRKKKSNKRRIEMSKSSKMLSEITNNIANNSLNLNNPQKFYSQSFREMLQAEELKSVSVKSIKKLEDILNILKDIQTNN